MTPDSTARPAQVRITARKAAWKASRALLGEVMGGAELEPAARDAFHAAFRAVILTCAGLAVLSGVIGALTAPGRQKAE